MNTNVVQQFDFICNTLTQSLSDLSLLVQECPSEFLAVNRAFSLVDRTFFILSCDVAPPQCVIFFLGDTNDCIDALILSSAAANSAIIHEISSTNAEDIYTMATVSISQLINPIFNYGSYNVSKITMLVAGQLESRENVVGIVFTFSFGIRLGLHVFDDHRLSICFNEMCDQIVSQARSTSRIKIIEKELALTESKPLFSTIDWFDWLG